MKRCLLALTLALALATPVAAEDAAPGEMSRGVDLLGQGAQLLLRGLMSQMEPTLQEMGKSLAELEPLLRDLAGKIESVGDYEMPQVLPNGDIIIRRKPDLPAPDASIDL